MVIAWWSCGPGDPIISVRVPSDSVGQKKESKNVKKGQNLGDAFKSGKISFLSPTFLYFLITHTLLN